MTNDLATERNLSAMTNISRSFANEMAAKISWNRQDRLNQWAHLARAQGPGFFLFEGPPTGYGEINF